MTTKQFIAGAIMALLFLCLPFVEANANGPTPILPEAMEHQDIRDQLNQMGYYDMARHEYFSMITSNAVTRFQRDFGLPTTGIAGPRTLAMLENIEMMARIVHGEARLVPTKGSYEAVREAWGGADPTGGAVYYYNPAGVTDSWIYSRTVLTKIGRHYFAE